MNTYYLRCGRCGHFNEVKSEYLVFCSKCNKKLDNNYSDWVIRNSSKTFDDFKQQVCTTNIEGQPTTMQKPNMFKTLKFWTIFTIAVVIFYAVGSFTSDIIIRQFKVSAYKEALIKAENEINKNCPILIDRETRLDNVIALPDNVFQYNYTLINTLKDSLNADDLKEYLEPSVINFVKSNPDMKTLRDNKTTINYYYKDKSGVYLFTISVKPNQYE